ncbi:hypothetical protein GXP67_27570 [Rhodocytophaga rosea]|uniref:Uncharacterized protein n=1 Tax=Rhodocytophaga rosea TaxID=2704465 RepID=A0A6C0GQ01_9BACT|nr:hypothetical protein [Rhodocytophaga rosea]QHT70139.1 hypothetical protein GXP67_27570 [Rhodocytophaga rosea]
MSENLRERISVFFFISCSLLLLSISLPCIAQQTVFNVPLTDIVDRNTLFFQEQIGITDKVQSTTTFTYGLGSNWQVGLNLANVTLQHHAGSRQLLELHSDHPEENPCLLLNLQKSVHITDKFDVSVGTQSGVGYINKLSHLKPANFSYLMNQLTFGKDIIINAGGYHSTKAFAGEGTNLGFMTALQLPLIPDKLNFQAEYISGTNQYSNCTLGFAIQLKNDWQLQTGAQIPLPGSDNIFGITLQISSQ